jgi:hypothetical protein
VRRRWALTGAATAAVGLSVLFLKLGLDRSDQLGSVISAFTGIVALGVSVLSLRRPPGPSPAEPGIDVARTGRIIRRQGGGTLNTGFWGPAPRGGPVVIRDTGAIDQGPGDGDANTGVRHSRR